MLEIDKRLRDMLTEFMIREIGAKILDGITYTFVDIEDKERYNEYITIKNEALKQGFGNRDIFRVFRVVNGFIFDMDIDIAKRIAQELYKIVARNNRLSDNANQNPNFHIINDKPDIRRKEDLSRLSKLIIRNFNDNKKELEVALFSKNSGNQIIINGKLSTGEQVSLRYHAFALRHYDFEILNEEYLIPNGIRVKEVQPLEILSSKTGVSFNIAFQSIDEYLEEH